MLEKISQGLVFICGLNILNIADVSNSMQTMLRLTNYKV